MDTLVICEQSFFYNQRTSYIYNPTVLNKVYNIVLSRHNYFDEGIVEVVEARHKTSNSAVSPTKWICVGIAF